MTASPAPFSVLAPAPVGLFRLLACAAARGVALFIAVFSIFNVLLQWFFTGFDANQWWIDFRPLPAWVQIPFLLVGSGFWIAYAAAPRLSPLRRRLTLTACELLGLVAVWNGFNYYLMLNRHTLFGGPRLPFGFLVAAAIFLVWRAVARREQAGNTLRAWIVILGAFGLCAIAFPLAQMIFLGLTDFRRPADVIVVFGAPVEPNGDPSAQLMRHLARGVLLYRQKLAPKLLFTGARGPDEPDNEVHVMRSLALRAGVRPEDILVDDAGLDMTASIEGTGIALRNIADDRPPSAQQLPLRVLVVSSFYHLPRLRMAYQHDQTSANSWQIFPVPAVPILQEFSPRQMAREAAAQWKYYLKALLAPD